MKFLRSNIFSNFYMHVKGSELSACALETFPLFESEKKITTQFQFSFILRLAFGLTRGKKIIRNLIVKICEID